MNVSQALAQSFAHPASLTTEQKLFQQALHQTEKSVSKDGKRPPFFDVLSHARTLEDLNYALEAVRKSNRFWSDDMGTKWLRNISKFAERILVYKGVLDAVVTRSSNIGSPIWGSLAFILGVLKDFSSTSLKLANLEDTLQQSMERFQRLFADGNNVSSIVEKALVRYYEVVITFAVEVHGEFQASRTRTVFNAVHRTLYTKLVELNDKIYHMIDHVDKGANLDLLIEIRSNVRSFGPVQYVPAHRSNNTKMVSTLTKTNSIYHNLHTVNSNFTGRKSQLNYITGYLNDKTHGGNSIALYGMGGIGKTQLLKHYAHEQLRQKSRQVIVFIDAYDTISVSNTIEIFMRTYVGSHNAQSGVNATQFGAFHTWLATRDDWLLIFDNVRDKRHIRDVVPIGHCGQILYSTRQYLVASQLAERAYEILPMNPGESVTLATQISKGSPMKGSSNLAVLEDIASFARGIPLLIEQIIHNAILGDQSLQEILLQVSRNADLLRHKNVSSLHEDNISLGGVICQTFDMIRQRSDKAEALFSILVYLNPSAIPIDMIREGATHFQAFLKSPQTYSRGAVDPDRGTVKKERILDSTPHRLEGSPIAGSTTRSWLGSSQNLSKWWRRSDKNLRLPVDDQHERSVLAQTCGSGTAFGRLFENQDAIDDALVTLKNVAIVRYTSHDTLWIHDRVSEVAKALIESQSIILGQQMALTAAVTVFHSLPHPELIYSTLGREVSNRRLPHALICHKNLESAGILNDSSIGPELSHLIASTMAKNGSRPSAPNDYLRTTPTEEAIAHDAIVRGYYEQAYHGYMAGWRRLNTLYLVTDKHIRKASFQDHQYEIDTYGWAYNSGHFTIRTQRLGSSAPWRAMQTATRIAHYASSDSAQMSEVVRWLELVLKFNEETFGVDDQDTWKVRESLYLQFGEHQQNWQQAREYGLRCIARYTRCKYENLDKGIYDPIIPAKLNDSGDVNFYTEWVGDSSLKLAEAQIPRGESVEGKRLGQQAVYWYQIRLKFLQGVYGENFFILHMPMRNLAMAFEHAGELRSSIQWFGRSILCALTPDISGNITSRLNTVAHNGAIAAIRVFRQARQRLLGSIDDYEWTRFDNDAEMKEFISSADHKIQIWEEEYRSREKVVVNDPYKSDYETTLT